MKLFNMKKPIITLCIIVMLIIVLFILYKYLYKRNDFNNKSLLIETFDETDQTVQNYITELQKCFNKANLYVALIDPCKQFIDYTNASINSQNGGMNIDAQDSSDKAKCVYNKINAYMTKQGLDMINDIPYLNNQINTITTKLKNYVDGQVVSAVNANTSAQNLVTSTQGTVNDLKQILNNTPPADATQIDNLTSTINSEQTELSQMKQVESGRNFASGLFFTMSSKFFNGDVEMFNNSPPMMKSTYGNNSLSNQGTGINMIGAPDGYQFATDSGLIATHGRKDAQNCIINGDGQYHCSICNSTMYNGTIIHSNTTYSMGSYQGLQTSGNIDFDEFGVWNRVLNANEIYLLMKRYPSLINEFICKII